MTRTSETDFALYGTRKTEARPLRLSAGRLSVDLASGNLRTIRYDGVEVLRAVSYLVRDRDWGTYSPELVDLSVDQRDAGFVASYTSVLHGPGETDLAVRVTITALSESELVFDAEALSSTGFETNRCGFCVLHPITGVAGEPVRIEHVDGVVAATRFPDLIEPWQPFKDMRAITHNVMGHVTAECRMEGDTFEMEDQRNWSDASYKTYVRPLALPWPYQLSAGEPVRQRVILRIDDTRGSRPVAANSNAASDTVTISRGARRGVMPAIGLVITPEEAQSVLAAREMLASIGAQQLLFHYDPDSGHGGAAIRDFADIAGRHAGSTTLEIALPCKRTPAQEAVEIATLMRAHGFAPDAVMISPSIDRQSTPPGSQWPECPPLDEVYAAARAAFPGQQLGGGMLSYFTELNRKRAPTENLDFVSHCTNPIVHAADDLSIMQTLEALPFITRSVRAIYGDKPYRIGPSTIPMRQNPYGSRTMDNGHGDRIAMANRDPRHNGQFAQAFALGYVARILDADLECLTLSALTGPFGLVAGSDEPVAAGGMRPLHNVVKALADHAGAEWLECASSDPAKVLAFLTQSATGSLLWLVNVTASAQEIDFQSVWLSNDATGGGLTLQPYETRRIDVLT